MFHLRRISFPLLFISALSFTLTGCTLNRFNVPVDSSETIPAIAGYVRGGQQPVSGALIQLYAASSSAAKGASIAVLTTRVTTDQNGNFTVTENYSCPSGDPMVYVVATGGNPGLSGNVSNTGLALMAAAGPCSSLTQSSYVNINELTTVAAVEALAPFMADYAHVGSAASNSLGLSGAFSGAAALVNIATGQIATAPSGVTLPIATLNTLGDILAACINTTGGTAGDMTNCGKLFGYAGTGANTDTIGAMLNIVQHPAQNVSQLFALASGTPPFQPALGIAPSDFTVSETFALPKMTTSLPQGYYIVIDAAQHIWVYVSADTPSSGSSYSFATGNILIYDGIGNLLHTVAAGAGGLSLPVAGTSDASGNVWAANLNGTISKFGPDGSTLSPAAGYPFPFQEPPNLSYGPGEQGDDISSIGADTYGNIWGIASGPGTKCYNEVNQSGTTIAPSGNFCTQDLNNTVAEVVADGSGNVWMLGTDSISKVNQAGNLVVSGVRSNGCFDFYPTGSSQVGSDTLNLAYDRSHDQVWGMGAFTIGALRADGSQVFCDANGQNLPLIPFSFGTGTFKELEVAVSNVDGAGNLWFASGGVIESGSTATYVGGLNELDSNGNLLTPFNASTGVYGLNVQNSFLPSSTGAVQGLAIDSSGYLWSVNSAILSMTKTYGLAAPKTYQ